MEYGCIGRRLPHSFSKEIHALIAPYRYELTELEPEEVPAFMLARDFKAINVTIPYKETVIPYLSFIDPVAERIGAVNTVVNRMGRLYGYNTDVIGMKAALNRAGISLAGKKALILGSGGTAKTAAAAAEDLGASAILTVSRRNAPGVIGYAQAAALHGDARVIINAMPVGMYPDLTGCPLDLSPFTALEGVFDAVYNPLRTRFAAAAKRAGAKAETGLYMLVAQAVAAYGYFTDSAPDPALTGRIYGVILREKRNIVLIGMPGCGKSTVGALIAGRTGRRLIDLDEEIVKEAGESIPSIFERSGEAAFRDLETRVLRKIAGTTGAVIATGGGCVLRAENTALLKANGSLYFLDRPLNSLLPTEDRPLARSKEAVQALYRDRYEIYKSAADAVIPVTGGAEGAAEEVERRHGY